MNGRLRRLHAHPPSSTKAGRTSRTNLASRFLIVDPFVVQGELATQFYSAASQKVLALAEDLAFFPHEAGNNSECIPTASNY